MSEAKRSRICLTCRTLFDHGEECRGKKHKTVDLLARNGRVQLDDEVWGPDSRARAMRQAAKAGAGGGAAGGLFDWCGGCDGFNACDAIPTSGSAGEALIGVLLAVVVIIVAAVLGAVLFWIIRALVRWLREKLRKPMPHGALAAAPKPRAKVAAASGVVKEGQLLDTPWREGSAFGWAMELHEERVLGGGAMLRDARTAGFALALDDGRVLRVPAGRIRVLGTLARVDSEEEKLENLVKDVDRARSDDEKSAFPFDYARAITIESGDRVEVLGDVAPDPEAEAGGYRVSAGGIVPVGVPYLRVTKAPQIRIATGPTLPTPGPVLDASTEPAPEEEEDLRASH